MEAKLNLGRQHKILDQQIYLIIHRCKGRNNCTVSYVETGVRPVRSSDNTLFTVPRQEGCPAGDTVTVGCRNVWRHNAPLPRPVAGLQVPQLVRPLAVRRHRALGPVHGPAPARRHYRLVRAIELEGLVVVLQTIHRFSQTRRRPLLGLYETMTNPPIPLHRRPNITFT